jgi:hypothetical protein
MMTMPNPTVSGARSHTVGFSRLLVIMPQGWQLVAMNYTHKRNRAYEFSNGWQRYCTAIAASIFYLTRPLN